MPSPDDVGAFDTKVCPYCAEVIKAAAIKCRFCQSDLTGTAPTPSVPTVPSRPASAASPAGSEPAAPTPGAAAAPSPKRPRSVSIRTMSFRQAPDGSLVPLPATSARSGGGAGPVVQDLETGRPDKPRRTVGLVATGVALLLVLGLLALAFRDWQAARELTASADAARSARASVAEKVEALLSYDHTTFDADLETAKEGMTASFQDEYEPTVAEIRDRALSQRRSQVAEVMAVAVVSQSPEEVEALVFVNTIASRTGTQAQRLMQNRVSVTLVQQDGTWLIDELSVPQA